MAHEIERRIVAPVNVLDHQQKRLYPGQRTNRFRERMKETSAIFLRVSRRPRFGVWKDRAKLRKQCHQFAGGGREVMRGERGRCRGQDADEIENRRVWMRAIR